MHYRTFTIELCFQKTGWEVRAMCRHYPLGPFTGLPTKEAAIGCIKDAIDQAYEREAYEAWMELMDAKIVSLFG